MRIAAALFILLALSPVEGLASPQDGALGVKKGIVVVAGTGSDTLPVDLAKTGELIVYVQVDDPEKAAKLRSAAEAAGFLGTRVYVEKGSLDRLHLANDLADGILAGGKVPRAEALRVLRPGGKAILGGETATKPYPEGADEWAHPYHGPDNNPQSKDTIARGPYLSKFLAEPWYSAMPQFSVFAGGRVFKIFGERTSTQAHWESLDSFVALNAWNGTLLWRRKLPDTFMFHRNTLVATADLVYLADAVSCKAYDAATGEVRDEIVVPEGISDGPVWKWMALENGILYALVGEKEPSVEVVKGDRLRGAGWPWWKIDDYKFGFGRTVMALDVKTKKMLWTYRDEQPLDARAMCMTAGRMFIYSDRKFLAALDPKTGKQLWRTTDERLLGAIDKHDPAQFAYKGFASTSFAKCTDKAIYFAGPTRNRIVAASAEDGKFLWQHEGGNYQLLIRPEAVYALGGSREDGPSLKLHPLTGETIAKFGARVACTRATANSESIFVRGGRGGSTTAYDIRSAEVKSGLISPMRPACQDGVIVANGQLYWGPWICRCDTTQVGVISLAPAGDFDYSAKATEAERLESGAAAAPAPVAVTDRDWPTYRRDNGRSGRSPLPVPADVVERWMFSPSEPNVTTAPIAAAGWVYLGGSDGVVRAVDGATGKLRWSYPTGGWIKFSPSLSEGRLYAGSGDGWVYCLEAATGRLIWRFRASPAERKIPVYGSLSSTWPVGSGVLVHDSVAYAAAGMANYDGSHVFALDAATGKIRWQNSTSGHNVLSPDSGAGVQGNLLLHNGALYMPGGQLAPVAKYDLADGKFTRHSTERQNILGKDLYVIDGEIRSTGYPLYWRQLDSHHITVARFPAEGGHFAIADKLLGLAEPKPGPQNQPKFVWSQSLFQECAGVAFGMNAVVVAGVDWTGLGPAQKSTGGLAAIDPKDGKVLWKRALPATPVMFGVSIDRDGRLLVALQDGRVVCLEAAGR